MIESGFPKKCPHGRLFFCDPCRRGTPPSEDTLALAREVIASRDAATTPVKGGPCPCGRGPAVNECGGAFPNGRNECEACVEDSIRGGVAFVMDTSLGGP